MQISVHVPVGQELHEGDLLPMGAGRFKARVKEIKVGNRVVVTDPAGKLFEGQRPKDTDVFKLDYCG